MLLGLGKDGPLSPDTQYFYVVGDSADARSEALSFTTPPLTGPESLPYRRAQGMLSVERAYKLVNEVEHCVLLERLACSGPVRQARTGNAECRARIQTCEWSRALCVA